MIVLPAATTAGGMCLGIPDICKTPPAGAPIAYPNMAQWTMSTGFVTKVVVEMRPVVGEGTKIPLSSGDEPGIMGGVISGCNMQMVQAKSFSTKVVFGGKKAVMLTSITGHNGSNANVPVGYHIVPSQMKVLVGL